MEQLRRANGPDPQLKKYMKLNSHLEDNSSTELSTREQRNNPFVSYEFLSRLRSQGRSAGGPAGSPATCWRKTPDGALLGAAPCYVKSHSRGEYVFDRGWAEAYERAGGDYYPKLQISVPFTPATGPRLLAAPGPLADACPRRSRRRAR